jgi:TIGR00730 family protein
MGSAARSCHEAGGRVLGIMPQFLRANERLYDEVETVIVTSMHERKILMYEQSDAFVVAPGGIGTLEEAIEVLSWKRLNLHSKPVIFLNTSGYWDSLVSTLGDGVNQGLTPTSFLSAFQVCDDVESTFAALETQG